LVVTCIFHILAELAVITVKVVIQTIHLDVSSSRIGCDGTELAALSIIVKEIIDFLHITTYGEKFDENREMSTFSVTYYSKRANMTCE